MQMFYSRKKVLLATCVALAVFQVSAAAEEKSNRLTASDVFNLQYAVDPQISPDGRRIVYVREFSDMLSDRRCSNLWVINFDGTDNRPLTTGTHSDTSPRWSSDGNRIAFLSDQDGKSQIYVRWMDTGQTAKITSLQQPPSGIAWSPDGKQISFASLVPSAPLRIANLPAAPAGAKWADPPKAYDKLIYRFNGPGYLEPGYTQLFVVSADGGAPRQISSGNFQHGGAAFRASPAVWTPDGKYLIASANRRADYEYEPLDTEVYEFSIADGSGILFLYDDQGDTKLGFYTLDGTLKQLTNHIGSGGTAYSFGSAFSVARNGAFATTYTRPDVPGDIAVGTLGNPSAKAITTLNADLLAQKRPGQVEEIWYESSLDKRKIHGWIIKPPDFNPSKKYPLIVEIHGGPFANYGDRFDVEKQIWAAKDYVVLYVNPRGSTSYGGEFGNLIHHAYPGDDFYDLNSGVDVVLAKGYVDADNLFVTGGSGGGVLTCWMIDRTNRFRAAASLYPVINWESFVLTADIPSLVIKYWFPGLPWDHNEHYAKRSLLSQVKNVKTPTLLMTGEEDYRTPISEAEQYFQALKLLKV